MKKGEGMSLAKILIYLEIIILRQLHQSQKDKNHVFSHMWVLYLIAMNKIL